MKREKISKINKSLCLLLGIVLITATIVFTPNVSANSDPWSVTLHFEDSAGGKKDYIIFGENSSASDGKDSNDVPKPGLPPKPYLYAWFDAGLSGPYAKLWEDHRYYDNTNGNAKIWNFNVTCNTSSPTRADTIINITWDKDDINDTEYSHHIELWNETQKVADMKSIHEYSFNADYAQSNFDTVYQFQIRCKVNTPVEFDSPNPINGSINQDPSLTWSISITDADSDTFNWSIDCSNGQSSSANGDTDGTKQLSISGLNYATTYTVWVNATDSYDSVSEWFTFTTRNQFGPDAPSGFAAVADGRFEIDLSWTDDTEADSTLVEWSVSADSAWNVGDHTELYNGSAEMVSHSGLAPGTQRFYKAWSWNATDGVWSAGVTDDATTDSNNPPSYGIPSPANGSIDQELSLTWSISITDADSDTFNWSIDCSNGQSSSAIGDTDGTKQLSISGLNYATTYTVWVNATDSYDSVSEWFTFTTRNQFGPDAPSGFAAVADGRFEIDLSWTDDTEADSTLVEWSVSADSAWNVGDHTELYNGSAEMVSHSGLAPGTQRFYKAWSWNATDGVWSAGVTDDATTDSNNPPSYGIPSPANGSIDQELSLTWSISITDADSDSFDWSIDCSNGQSGSAIGDTDGTKQLSISGLNYATTYTVWVNATDSYDSVSEWFTFTTRNQFGPDAPSGFAAVADGRFEIDLSWTDDTEADSTLVEWSVSADSAWNVGDHTELYNGSAEMVSHSGLAPGTQRFYKAWSWNATDGVWSAGVTDDATTDSNNPPSYGIPSPANGSIDQELSLTWSISITDADSDTFNWSIDCSNGQSSSAIGDTDGTKQLSISGLNYATTYTVWVNATDSYDSVSEWFTFTTRNQFGPDAPSGFAAVADGRFEIDLSWTDDTEADSTLVEWSVSADSAWNVGDHTELYNGSAEMVSHSGLAPGTQRFYKAWSWNATDGVWSAGVTDDATTDSNNPPSYGIPSPANGSIDQELSLTWSISITDADSDNFDWSIDCSNGQSSSAIGDTDGTKQLSISGLNYATTYTVWVNATDSYDSVSEWFTFTTRNQFGPDAPSGFAAVADGRFEIDLSWTDDTEADSTLVEWSVSADSAWNVGDHTELYNGSAEMVSHSGLAPGTQRFYKAWSWNATDGVWSAGVTDDATTDSNNPPSYGIPSPANGSIDQELSLTWSISITDADSDSFDWSIDCSNGQSGSAIGDTDGTKQLSISGLNYATTYTVWVNATDSYDSVSEWFTFTTRNQFGPDAPSGFAAVADGRFEIDLSWTDDTEADSTLVEWSVSADSAWNVGDHTELYNGSAEMVSHSGLAPGTQRFYKAWSWNATDGVWSAGVTDDATTDSNNPPSYGIPSPANGSIDQELSLTWSISITDADSDSFDWSIDCSNGQSGSAIGDTDGTKQLSISGLNYATTYTVWVNATDSYDSVSEWFTFTTRNQFGPDAPSGFAAVADGRFEIDLSWTDDTEADSTLVEWSVSADSAWNVGDHTELYNGSAEMVSHSGLAPGTQRFYKAWSWNATDGVWSAGVTDDATTDSNNPPSYGIPSPANGSIDQELSLTWSISITDADSDTFNWSIDCSNGQSSSAIGDTDGTKQLSISGLNYATTYTVWVNATDSYDSVSEWFTFTTRNQFGPDAPSGFAAVADGRFEIDLSWTDDTEADSTLVEWSVSADSAWNVGDHTELYNGSAEMVSHSGLAPGTQRFYKAWSWNATDGVWSAGVTDDATTDSNNPPSYGIPSPANGSIDQELSLTWSISITDADSDNFDWSIDCSNGQSSSAIGDTDGTKQLSISGLNYATTYTVWVNATDSYDSVSEWFTFTTRNQFGPDAPSGFAAVADGRFEIDLSWTDDTEADSTLVEWSVSADSAWNVGDHTELYNGSAEMVSHSGLAPGTQRFYKAWSWNATDGVWSAGVTDDATTDSNNPPSYGIPSPANGSIDQELSLTWSISITDADSDSFDWSIDCSNGQSGSAIGDTDGTKQLSISGLNYATTYTVWVNATDSYDSVSEWFTFTTRNQFGPDAPSGFAAVADGRFEIDLSWTDDTEADSTLVEWSVSADSAWNVGDHTELYNGSAEMVSHSGLAPGTQRFYKAWSWNATDGVWSAGVTDDATTDSNNPPSYGIPSPANGSIDQELSLTWSISITDADSDTFNWSIDCSNGQSSSAIGDTDGTKQLSISGLNYATTYTVWVNATDSYDSVSEWFTFTTRNADDVVFNSSFEMGNLINVTFQEGDSSGYRYYTANVNFSIVTFPDKHWWFYFSMENTTGKTITIELKNLSVDDFIDSSGDLPRWPDIEPVYTYNNMDWSRIPLVNVAWNSTALNFSMTIAPAQDKVWLAPIPPYTVSMRDDLFASYASSTYLNVSSLGITPLGQNVTVATITDPLVDDEGKAKIYVIAQQHAGETPSSFVAEGMIRFLLNETNETAARIRENCTFKIIPIVNPEGVYYGISRYTPFRGANQYDQNRAWDDDLVTMNATCPEVRWVFDDIQSWQPDVFIDHHSEVNGENSGQDSEDCFFLHDGLYDDAMIRLCDNISIGKDGTSDYWPETGARGATGSSMAAKNVRTRLGIHPSTSMEHPHDNRTSTPQHPTAHNPQTADDWVDWGRRATLGIYDYFRGIGEQEYRVSLNSSWNLVSLPFNESYDKTDIIVSYGGSNYTWDAAVSGNIILNFVYDWDRIDQHFNLVDILEPGYGYWMYAYYDCELILSGNVSDDDYITSLKQDWNLVGLPYNISLAKEDIIVEYNGTDYAWHNATTTDNDLGEPIILGFIYDWLRDYQSYGFSDYLNPGYGYWMYAHYNCTLKK